MAATAETLMAVLSLYWAIEQFDEWSDDIDNIRDYADENILMGEEYKTKWQTLRDEDQTGFDYINSLPLYERCDLNAQRASVTAQLNSRAQIKGVLQVIDADDIGSRAAILQDVCEFEAMQGAASVVDGINFEDSIADAYVQARARAIANSESPAVPDLGGAFRTVGQVYIDNSQRHAAGFNAAFYSFTRNLTSAYNRTLERGSRQRGPFIDSQIPGSNTPPIGSIPGQTPGFFPGATGGSLLPA